MASTLPRRLSAACVFGRGMVQLPVLKGLMFLIPTVFALSACCESKPADEFEMSSVAGTLEQWDDLTQLLHKPFGINDITSRSSYGGPSYYGGILGPSLAHGTEQYIFFALPPDKEGQLVKFLKLYLVMRLRIAGSCDMPGEPEPISSVPLPAGGHRVSCSYLLKGGHGTLDVVGAVSVALFNVGHERAIIVITGSERPCDFRGVMATRLRKFKEKPEPERYEQEIRYLEDVIENYDFRPTAAKVREDAALQKNARDELQNSADRE